MNQGSLFHGELLHEDYFPKVVSYYYKQWNGMHMPFHSHFATEIMYMISGVCQIDIEQHPRTPHHVVLKKGEFIVLDANVSHRLVVEDDAPCRMLNVEFCFVQDKGIFPSLKQLAMRDAGLISLVQTACSYIVLRDPEEVYHSLKSLVLELDSRLENNGAMVQLLLSQLLIRIARLQQETENNGMKPVDYYVKQTIDFLCQNYDRDIQIKEISGIVSLHPGYIQRIFKKQTGQTIMEYLTILRMEKAKMLLQQTDISIEEIADYVGIGSRQYFHTLFKKYALQTPIQFRKSTEKVNFNYAVAVKVESKQT